MSTASTPELNPALLLNPSRDIAVTHPWLHFPIKNGAPKRVVTISVVANGIEDRIERRFEIELADAQPDWWAPLDISLWQSQTLRVAVDAMNDDSRGLEQIEQSDGMPVEPHLYREALRPQFHFSAQRGWLNDPNGLVFFNGEYHLFFQHSPFSWGDALKHWGHAVSRDMVHWQEVGEALYPDDLGAMWSGSAVVDWKNSSGFGENGRPPLVLIYTAAGDRFTQCIAYSTDGRHFFKYARNPVVPNISDGNRDPKVLWHEQTQRWIMVLYVEKDKQHTIHFFTSPNLREWTLASVSEGRGGQFLYECPDFFELPVDGNADNTKWVLSAANSEYAVGTFDGRQFTAEATNLTGQHGRGFYAPQTFSDEPKGRRIQIGWMHTTTPGMPFNQSLSIPIELKLVSTADGPRLTSTPVPELASLRIQSHELGTLTIDDGSDNPLAALSGELLEINAEWEPGAGSDITFCVRGVPITFDARQQEIIVNGHRAPALLQAGKHRLTIFADRTSFELFVGGGLTFVPLPMNLDPDEASLSVVVTGGTASFSHLNVHQLGSAWQKAENT